jgi:SAM-dependent methyltransferase
MTVPALRDLVVTPAMKARVQTLTSENPEVKTLRLILGEPKIWEWAHSVGASTDPVLESLVPPFPPRDLRLLVAEPDLELFLWTGAIDVNLVLSAYEAHGADPGGRKPAILDFGCGCGRLSRFLVPCGDAASLYAADVNPDLVSWCRTNLPEIETVASGVAPPLPWSDGTFDLVYSLSVLTHLPEEALGAWMRELARAMRKDAILVVTTHGPRALERIEAEAELQRVVGLERTRAGQMLRELPGKNVLYVPYGTAQAARSRAGSSYGTTFLSEPFVRDLATRAGFSVLELRAAGLRGWQDVLIARRV